MSLNMAEELFEDIVFSRAEKNVLFFRLLGGWMIFYFKKEKSITRVFFKVRNGKKIAGDCSLEFFLRTMSNFFLKGDIEKICRFLKSVNLQKNRGLKKRQKISKRGCNIAKELVINFLLYRLSYERRTGLEVSLNETYQLNFQAGHFYIAQQCPRLKNVLGGYVLSLSYCFENFQNDLPVFLKVHLPHLNIHRRVREAVANIGLTIS